MPLRSCAPLFAALLSLLPAPAWAALQTKAQAKCVVALSGAGLLVARTTGKLASGCIKAEAKGKLTTGVDACIDADAKGKLAAARAKTLAQEGKLCAGPDLPDFGARSAATVNSAAPGQARALVEDLLGDPLPGAADEKSADGCRLAALGAAAKLFAAEIGAFNACTKTALATATGTGTLTACLTSLPSDKKVAKGRDGLGKMRSAKCADATIPAALPGLCGTSSGSGLDSCLTSRASCRACEALAAMDDLVLDCDLFDDALANSSCPGGTLPTTTTTTSTTSTTDTTTTTTTLPHSSCKALLDAEPMAASGVYTIAPDGSSPFPAYCDMTTAGGGWTVFQRRSDGSVSFARDWAAYAAGFGGPAGEHWLGNERIHALTATGTHELYIALNDGTTDGYARYATFALSDAADSYRLSVSDYSGDVGDGLPLVVHNGQPFSTYDVDNDVYPGNCSATYDQAGWWFGACHVSNLNGAYSFPPGPIVTYATGISWYYWRGYYFSLASSRMMLR